MPSIEHQNEQPYRLQPYRSRAKSWWSLRPPYSLPRRASRSDQPFLDQSARAVVHLIAASSIYLGGFFLLVGDFVYGVLTIGLGLVLQRTWLLALQRLAKKCLSWLQGGRAYHRSRPNQFKAHPPTLKGGECRRKALNSSNLEWANQIQQHTGCLRYFILSDVKAGRVTIIPTSSIKRLVSD